MRSKTWLIIAVLLIALTASVANPPAVQWTRTYGGSYRAEEAYSAQKTSDGGFVLVGYILFIPDTTNLSNQNLDVYLVKTDSAGNLLWERTFGDSGVDEEGQFVLQTSDKGYIITGEAEGNVLLIKTDSLGNLCWQKNYGGDDLEYGMCVRQTVDGGYIISGARGDGIQWADLYLLRTDSLGDSLWAKAFSEYGEGSAVIIAEDGGYVITGLYGFLSDTADFYEDRKLYLMKTDSMGNLKWRQTYPNGGVNVGSAVLQTQDGGYIVAGEGRSLVAGNSMDVLLMKTDSLGNLVWKRTFGGSNWDGARGQCVAPTADGGYIIAGETCSWGHPKGAFYLIRTDSLGNTLWTKVFDRNNINDDAYFVLQTNDGGYVVGGGWEQPESWGIDMVLIKLYPEGQ